MRLSFKLFFLIIPLSLALLTACSDLIPFMNNEVPSIREGLPGVWGTTYIDISEGKFEIFPTDSKMPYHFTTLPQSIPVRKNNPLYTILKFQDNNIYILDGTHLFNAPLASPFPYELLPDSTIICEILKKHFNNSSFRITSMDRNSFVLTADEKGRISNLPENASADTLCISRSVNLKFNRLR
ncbi:MAG: hypothetical protein K2N03_05950 [Muribaculaceae bacterium]|nr:hypothetical protein [Muribaculaceae bacterium]